MNLFENLKKSVVSHLTGAHIIKVLLVILEELLILLLPMISSATKVTLSPFPKGSEFPFLVLCTYSLPVLTSHPFSIYYYYFFKDFIYLERGREREIEGEKHQCVVAFCEPPTGDLALNSGICPDWELNWRTLGLQAGAQSTEPHQPGFICFALRIFNLIYDRTKMKGDDIWRER